MVPDRLYGPTVIPVFGPCRHRFTTDQSQALERADAFKRERAAIENERRRERERIAAERRAAEAPRLRAIQKRTEAAERERLARLEIQERRTWLTFWLWMALIFAGATCLLYIVTSGRLALVAATATSCGFAIFRLLIVGFDPPLRRAEDLYVTLVWGVMGLVGGFLLHALAGVGS